MSVVAFHEKAGRSLAGQLLPYGLWIVLLWIAVIPVFRTSYPHQQGRH